MIKSRLRITAIVTATALALTPTTVTQAQSAPETTTVTPSATANRAAGSPRDFFYEFSQLPFLSVGILQFATGILSLPVLNLIPIGAFKADPPAHLPHPIDNSIKEVKLISREPSVYPDSVGRRIERWTISSPSMGRNILVDVRLPKPGDGPAPQLIMLDGLGARTYNGWLFDENLDEFDRTFKDENVTVVFPLDAPGTWYSDWERDDPKLGRQKWETFITKELIPVLEAQADTKSNGKRGIGGLSMGATGSVHIANQHPDKFDAVFGISGCYTTMGSLGRQTAVIVPQTQGARPIPNMWGRYGSKEWRRHDVTSNPEGLRNQSVYLSTATGGLSINQRDSNDSLAVGWALEVGTYQCTRELETSMKSRGMNQARVEYRDRGIHNWPNFISELYPAWNHIKPALY